MPRKIKKTAKKSKTKCPSLIYVNAVDAAFNAECQTTLDEFDDGAEVAIYELTDVRKVVKKTELV